MIPFHSLLQIKIPVTITAIIRKEKEPRASKNVVIFPHNNSKKDDSSISQWLWDIWFQTVQAVAKKKTNFSS
jgi:hypothetical protein